MFLAKENEKKAYHAMRKLLDVDAVSDREPE